MKRIKWVIVFLMFVWLLPIEVNAQNFTATLSGTSKASTDDKIDFTISIKSDKEAIGFEATIKYDNTVLEFINISKEDKWTGNNTVESTGNNTLKFTNTGVTGESSVATLRFKVKSSTQSITTITIDGLRLTLNSSSDGEDSTILTTNSITKDISIRSDDNTLKNIKVDDKTIKGFSSSVKEYTLEVDSLTEEINVSATLNDPKNATFVENFGNRTVKLEYGQNKVLIKTKSESGKEAIYTLNVIRKDDRLVNNDLKSIIINGGTIKIDFDPSILSYTIKTYKLDKIEIEAEASDAKAKVKINSPSKLVLGENKVKISVTAVTGDVKEYNLLIVNTDQPTDTRLKNLSVKGVNIGFNSDKYDYSIRYDKSYKNGIKIYNTTLSEDVEVKIDGNENLKEGSVIKITVTALDGSSTSEYTITLEKDNRINFFLILDVLIGATLIVLIIIQLRKRKKQKEQNKKIEKEKELEKTKEIIL